MVAASVAGLGGLLFGYDNIVISGAIRYLSRCFHLETVQVGWAAGCALIGCIAGSAAAGAIVDRIGLKKGLFLCAGCFLGSSAGMLFAGSFRQFVFWRLLGGLGIGGASIISPMTEYGFQSFPEMRTIRSFAEPQDFDIRSKVMQAHQKNKGGNERILTYMSLR